VVSILVSKFFQLRRLSLTISHARERALRRRSGPGSAGSLRL
jgi:hypothetical protein